MLETQRALNERKGRRLRWAAIPLFLAVFTVVGQAVVFAWQANPVDRGGCMSDEGDAERPSGAGLPDEDVQQALALSYAPRVYVHPNEKWGPLRPDDFIDASSLVWNSSEADEVLVARGDIDATRLGADCEKADGGCYEHRGCAADQVTRPTESPGLRPPGLNERRGFAIDPDTTVRRPSPPGNPNIPVYYEFHGKDQSLRLTYWFFYGYSQPNLGPAQIGLASHEGDWESIDVKLQGKGGAETTRTRPASSRRGSSTTPTARTRRFSTGPRRRWSTKAGAELTGAPPAPAHPVVFSAVGSHASYPSEGGQAHGDQTRRGPVVWDTWQRPVLRCHRRGLVGVRRRLGRRRRPQGPDRPARPVAVEAVVGSGPGRDGSRGPSEPRKLTAQAILWRIACAIARKSDHKAAAARGATSTDASSGADRVTALTASHAG